MLEISAFVNTFVNQEFCFGFFLMYVFHAPERCQTFCLRLCIIYWSGDFFKNKYNLNVIDINVYNCILALCKYVFFLYCLY